jgi:hypothetical protein
MNIHLTPELEKLVQKKVETGSDIRLLAEHPEIGHRREDLTDLPVKFWPVATRLMDGPRFAVHVIH